MMIHPSPEKFAQAAESGNVIPVFVELPADLETPLSVYLKLKRSGPSFLLESVQQGESVGRYSFVGIGPRWLLRIDGKQVRQWDPAGKSEASTVKELDSDAFETLEGMMKGFRPAEVEGLPRFWGGAVGYFGYDTIREVEPRLDSVAPKPSDGATLPRACFVYSRTSVLFDHVRQRMFVVVAAVVGENASKSEIHDAYHQAVVELGEVQKSLAHPLVVDNTRSENGQPAPRELKYHTSKEDFCESVLKAKEYIAAGDIFQVVLSQRVSLPSKSDAVSLYRALRLRNPSPYMLLLDFEDFQIIGASPEMLVKLEGTTASYRPLAGTRPRGLTAVEDQALEKELLADPKERAEHVMLVDLGRNDLGKVCKYGSVHVPQFMTVDRFSHVMHIVSLVEGEINSDSSGLKLLRACFPAGTVSGAPKVRAMQIIEELEPSARGPYSGTVGTISFGGDVNTCIAIRTMWKVDDRLYLQAGAGIVADSDPELEYRETLAKLEGILSAVDLATTEFVSPQAKELV